MITISELNPTLTEIRKTALYCLLTLSLLILLWMSHKHLIPAVFMFVTLKSKNSIKVSITRNLAAFTAVFCKTNNQNPYPVCFSPQYSQSSPVNFEFFKKSFCKDIKWWRWFRFCPQELCLKNINCACAQYVEQTILNLWMLTEVSTFLNNSVHMYKYQTQLIHSSQKMVTQRCLNFDLGTLPRDALLFHIYIYKKHCRKGIYKGSTMPISCSWT